MNILNLSDSYQAVQEQALNFTNTEIIPYANQFDQQQFISRELIDKLSQAGYLAPFVPEEYEGRNLDMLTAGVLNEAIGYGCSSTRSLLTVHGMVALGILRWGSEQQRGKWLSRLVKGKTICSFALTEAEHGSDVNGIETEAAAENNHYVINGKKKWITFASIADLFLVIARLNGKLSAFLVTKETPGLSVHPIHGLLGVRASMSAELIFKNCKIPKENLLGREGLGFSQVGLTALDYGRYTIAWGCVGGSQACIDASIEYARTRKQFKVPIRRHQLIQKMITEMVVNVKAARLLCYNAGLLKDNNDPDSIEETWNAKYFSSKVFSSVSRKAVQIFGANGCHDSNFVSRFFRDAKIMEIVEGSSQIHEILVANEVCRKRNFTQCARRI